MIPALLPLWFVLGSVFLFGIVVGSFLNVCIHRIPRGHSIVAPRSKCYSCERTIAWFDNIPLLSYILLGGKCRHCGARFSIRYFGVELLTGILFVLVWKYFSPSEAIVYTIFVSGLITATFIDFEHYIIPNEITLGGVLVGVLCSGLVPSLQNEQMHSRAAFWSIVGAAVGYGTLWAVVELGKKMFGVKKIDLGKPTEVFITSEGIRIENETDKWDEIFSRESDTLTFSAIGIRLGDKKWDKAEIKVNWQKVSINEEAFELSAINELMAVTKLLYVPREAMGFGDVKFLAAIGAFLGPKAIFFVILISSFMGSFVGLSTIFLGKREWGLKLPYGPYLALAALIWIFGGSSWLSQYLAYTQR
jgi:leader peptidase (prepilin peptidase) / N-methyltransferase